MTTCPNCSNEIKPGKTFCGRCGTAVPEASSAGCSSLAVDAAALEKLLQTYAPQVQLRQGQLELRQGDTLFCVHPVRIHNPDLTVQIQHGPLGSLKLEVDLLTLGPEGLSVNLRLS